MSGGRPPEPRSPEAVQLTAEAIVGSLVMRVRGQLGISTWGVLADHLPFTDAITTTMALDYLVRGGWVETRKVPDTDQYLVILDLGRMPHAS